MINLDLDYISKKKLCPFMSDSKNKIYCTEECALATTTVHDPETNKLLGIECSLSHFADILEAIRDVSPE
jgi:hypothetical protein